MRRGTNFISALLTACVLFGGGGLLAGCDQRTPSERSKTLVEAQKKRSAERAGKFKPIIPDRLAPYVEADAVWTPQENPALWWYDEEHLLFEAKDMTKAEGIPLTKVPSALYLWEIGKEKPVKVSNELWDGSYCAGYGYLKIGLGFFDKQGVRFVAPNLPLQSYREMAGAWPGLSLKEKPPFNERPPFYGAPRNISWAGGSTIDCRETPINKRYQGYKWLKLKDEHGILLSEKLTKPRKDKRGWTYYKDKEYHFRSKIISESKSLDLPFNPLGRVKFFAFNNGYFAFPKYGGDGLKAKDSLVSCTPMHWFWANGETQPLCVDTKGNYTANFYPVRGGVLFSIWAKKGPSVKYNGLSFWRSKNGDVVRVLKGLATPVSTKTSPDGCRVATIFKENFSDYKNTIRVFDVCRLGDNYE